MYIGKRNLLETIKLLDPDKVNIERIDLMLSNGMTVQAKQILIDGPQICAKNLQDGWVMLPDEELIGIAVAFGDMPKGLTTLPEVVEHLKKRKAKAA